MRRSLFIMLMAVTSMVHAQSLETTSNYPTGYIETSYYDKNNTITSIDGVLYLLYDDIPVVLLRYPSMNPREEYEIPSTVRRINNNAFQGTKYLKTLKIHNIVSYNRNIKLAIGETAFNDSSIENFIVIENDQSETAIDKHQATPRKEIARYDLSGRKVNKDFKGLKIVKYNDSAQLSQTK